MRKLLDGTGWIVPARLEFRTDSIRSPGGAVHIEEWLKAHPEARLVIIDTLQKMRPAQKGGQKDGYADDYEALGPIKTLADRYAVAVLVLHHSRKASAESPFDEISGTLGLTGAADGMFLLQRDHESETAALYVTGRDIEEETLSLAWDDANCLWSITNRESGINRPAPTEPGQRIVKKSPRIAECAQWIMQHLVNVGPCRLSTLISEAEISAGKFVKSVVLTAIKDRLFEQYEDPDGKKARNGSVYQWVRLRAADF